MRNRKTLTRSVCTCGAGLGGHGDMAIRDMPRLRVWLWQLRHRNHWRRHM